MPKFNDYKNCQKDKPSGFLNGVDWIVCFFVL